MTEVEMLKAQIADLRATVKALRLMVQDLGGLPPDTVDNMYEDEAPLVVWESDK